MLGLSPYSKRFVTNVTAGPVRASEILALRPMWGLPRKPIISTMNSRPTHSKVLLLAGPRVEAAGPATLPIRRYRLARLRFDAPPAGEAGRFEHLKRVYD